MATVFDEAREDAQLARRRLLDGAESVAGARSLLEDIAPEAADACGRAVGGVKDALEDLHKVLAALEVLT